MATGVLAIIADRLLGENLSRKVVLILQVRNLVEDATRVCIAAQQGALGLDAKCERNFGEQNTACRTDAEVDVEQARQIAVAAETLLRHLSDQPRAVGNMRNSELMALIANVEKSKSAGDDLLSAMCTLTDRQNEGRSAIPSIS